MTASTAAATGFDVIDASIADIHDAYRAGTLTARRLVEI